MRASLPSGNLPADRRKAGLPADRRKAGLPADRRKAGLPADRRKAGKRARCALIKFDVKLLLKKQ